MTAPTTMAGDSPSTPEILLEEYLTPLGVTSRPHRTPLPGWLSSLGGRHVDTCFWAVPPPRPAAALAPPAAEIPQISS